MFTGIVAGTGEVVDFRAGPEGAALAVRALPPLKRLAPGESVAVEGVCLTAEAVQDGIFTAQLSPETLRRTTLGQLQPGDPVNLEAAVTPATPLGGHLVLGHVDGVGEVVEVAPEGNGRRVTMRAPAELARYWVPRGSVAVNGVSLTIVDPQGDRFTIVLIPHTLASTTLARLVPGSQVNLEADILGKYAVGYLEGRQGGRGA